ncbi:MAG: MBL fold metallo-hydrolase [Clostridia bacterium]|nr:MBL fold metallo-hydrolase [Clostridia bacterium]
MTTKVADDIFYLGVDDHVTDLFEDLYPIPDGISYNSYVIMDEKTAVMDTVCGVCDADFDVQWLSNLEKALNGRTPDYLVISHMEPDHSSVLDRFVEKYPSCTVIGNKTTFTMIDSYFAGIKCNRKVVADGETVELGKHSLKFLFAPMVHWPEVMVSYDAYSKVLFSADAFGKFGALDVTDIQDWEDEARRYYIGIVGKFGSQVLKLLYKLTGLTVKTICALHGPVLKDNIDYYIDKYMLWAKCMPEEKGVFIGYGSVYGHTKAAAEFLAEKLAAKGYTAEVHDLSREHWSYSEAAAFRLSKMVLCSPTYNGGVFTPVENFLDAICERNYQGRVVGIIENGSWAPMAAKKIKEKLSPQPNVKFTDTLVTMRPSLDAAAKINIIALAEEITSD